MVLIWKGREQILVPDEVVSEHVLDGLMEFVDFLAESDCPLLGQSYEKSHHNPP